MLFAIIIRPSRTIGHQEQSKQDKLDLRCDIRLKQLASFILSLFIHCSIPKMQNYSIMDDDDDDLYDPADAVPVAPSHNTANSAQANVKQEPDDVEEEEIEVEEDDVCSPL
jgi:hypothetical protein